MQLTRRSKGVIQFEKIALLNSLDQVDKDF